MSSYNSLLHYYFGSCSLLLV
uniref:Uncharacterized protein n=1 Tax=Rhizophora mucronata TaxID=61149 RepID=A0A2P2QKF7_RHIMU